MLPVRNLKAVTSDIHNNIWLSRNISLSMLRLDMIHPVVPGNKLFKLHYFLQSAAALKLKIITFGGAYSNHLAATAAACRHYGLECIGIVRGEAPSILSPTLLYCLQQNMLLEFISRNNYNQKQEQAFKRDLQLKFGDHVLIPEGGFSAEGVKGAAEIYTYIAGKGYTHICCPVGTGTTAAGLIQAAGADQQVIGFTVVRKQNFEGRLDYLLGRPLSANYRLIESYDFGGYAKKSNALINFMNDFYDDHSIPLDFVYTGKMMYGVTDMIRQNFFREKSRILCIHTGGLQGNSSLAAGVLKY